MTGHASRRGSARATHTERASSASAFADRTISRLRGLAAGLAGTLLFASGMAIGTAAAQTAPTPPGTLVRNTATVSVQRAPGVVVDFPSNEVTVTTVPARSRASASLLRAAPATAGTQVTLGPAQCTNATGQAVDLPAPTLIGGTVLDVTRPVTVLAERAFHGGEPVFLSVSDADQNLDATKLDYLVVDVVAPSTGDRERIRLVETGPDTGTFTGYVPTRAGAATPADCTLDVSRGGTLELRYADAADRADSAAATAVIDPQGTVFDSRTGAPVSGARVRLVDATTGQPAVVLGDDGRSAFPSEVTSGATATDAGGTLYQFPPGTYRFPLVARAGTYRLIVEPPSGYDFPSQVDEPTLQTLPGAPFVLGAGAFGRDYAVQSPVAVTLDVPVDQSGGPLLLQITPSAGSAAIGDAIQYTVTLRNAGPFPIRGVDLTALLPPGFRYVRGSTRDGAGVVVADPAFGGDASNAVHAIAQIDGGQTITLRFVVRVGAGARAGNAVTRAQAKNARVASNDAAATVRLVDDLFRTRGMIVGRIAVGTCDAPGADGVANVRVYLEDGRYAVTDSGGRFHIEDVEGGAHVVQLDRPTLPDTLTAVACADRAGARDAWSRVVELRAGGLQRADFVVQATQSPSGRARVEGTLRDGDATFVVNAERVPLRNARVMLAPTGSAAFVPGGLRVDGRPADVKLQDGIAVIAIGDVAAGRALTVTAGATGAGSVRGVLLFDGPAAPGIAVAPVDVPLAGGPTASAEVAVDGLKSPLPPRTRAASRNVAPDLQAMEALPRIDSLRPRREWLLPSAGFAPPIPALHVAVKHAPDDDVRVTINGVPVPAPTREQTLMDTGRTLAVSRWRGVPLVEGENRLVATIVDRAGAETQLERVVYYGGAPVRAELDEKASTLVADGRTRPVLAVRLYDRFGHAARPGLTGTFRVEPPNRAWSEIEALRDNPLTATAPREPTWTVDANGVAKLELEPTSQAGNAVAKLNFGRAGGEEVRAWLAPAARDWVLVGLASGTAAWRQVESRAEPLPAGAPADGYDGDGRVAFFAKGRIRGDWLLTIAYDSDRRLEAERERVLGTIDPKQYYTLYGDATESRDDAPSRRKVYVKLERGQASALFGDFETGYTVTELARYSRMLNGVRVEGGAGAFHGSAFAARGNEALGRDVFQGDGTSGPFRLSARSIVVGSDRVRIEVRDRFRSEIVVDTRTLQRGLDYDLDYFDGTIYFRRPLASRSDDFDPVYAVVEYEAQGTGVDVTTAGGRATVKALGGRVEAGATVIHEGGSAGARELGGLDARARLGESTQLHAEVAKSRSDDPTRPADGVAYLAEVQHVADRAQARAYVREQDGGFGLGQQTATETGTRKIGAEARVKVNDVWSVRGQAYEQQALGTDDRRRLGEGEVRWSGVRDTLRVGLRAVQDRREDEEQRSDQLFAGITHDLYDGRVLLKATAEYGLGRSDSLDFPDRARVGADWRVSPDYALFVEHERARNAALTQDMTRFGVRTQPWAGGQIETALNDAATENGSRLYSTLGLTQGWRLNERWSVDVGAERASTLSGGDVAPLTGVRPSYGQPAISTFAGSTAVTSGFSGGSGVGLSGPSTDFTSAFLGAGYRAADWSMTSRLERREGREEDRSIVSLGVYRETGAGRAFSLALRWSDSSGTGGAGTSADTRLSWAYRPDESRWIGLDRLDLLLDDRAGTRSERIVNNLHLNGQLDPRTQLGLQLGTRYARQQFDGDGYGSVTLLYGVDLRRDLDSRWDVGTQATVFDAHSAATREYSFGVDVGRRFGSALWVSLGYNFAGFTDRDFSRDRYTARGPFVRFRLHVDQDSLKDFVQAWTPGARR